MSSGGLVDMVIIMAAVLAPVVVVYGIVDLRRWHRRKAKSMPEIEELRKLVEEAIGKGEGIDEHVHVPTIVSTMRLVNEKIAALEERMNRLESNQEILRRFTPGL